MKIRITVRVSTRQDYHFASSIWCMFGWTQCRTGKNTLQCSTVCVCAQENIIPVARCHSGRSSFTCILHYCACCIELTLFFFSLSVGYLTPFGYMHFCHGNLLEITDLRCEYAKAKRQHTHRPALALAAAHVIRNHGIMKIIFFHSDCGKHDL